MTSQSLSRAITTRIDPFAPPQFRWMATVGEYDLDVLVGQGATPDEAKADLEAQLDEIEHASEPETDPDQEWLDDMAFERAHAWGRP